MANDKMKKGSKTVDPIETLMKILNHGSQSVTMD